MSAEPITIASMLTLLFSAIMINNVIFSRFLGICPYLGVSNSIETATGMAMAVTFVMTLCAIVTWPIQMYILNPLHLEYLQTIVFILVIASLVQFVELFMRKYARGLFDALGIYLPLITTNCAVLGIAILCIKLNYNLVQSIVFSFASALGFGMALIIFAGIRERFEVTDIPGPMRGAAIGLITAGILAMAFTGFSGMVK